MNHSKPHYDADVVIIGYGPSGVTAANTLASRGVSAIAFERDIDIYPRARAVTVNDWTMRIFQDLGLDAELLPVLDPQRALRWVTYDGTELMRVSFTPSTLGTVEGTRFYNMYQPALEPILRAGGERFPELLEVRYGWEVLSTEQDADGVTVTARNLATGEERKTRARYALACDGGSSPTRHALGIELLGDTLQVTWIVIDCKVKRWWPDRDYLTFWSDKRRPVVDIPLPLGNHRWEIPLREGESPADFATEDQVWPLLEDLGVSHEDVDIYQHAFYQHHERMGERWRDRRIFLVGDAGHLMPPWAGAGMQSGMRDAYDISWKLARVLDHTAPEAILDSYETERRPNVDFYTNLAIGLGKIIKQELSDEELAAATAPPHPESRCRIPRSSHHRCSKLAGCAGRSAKAASLAGSHRSPRWRPRTGGCCGSTTRSDATMCCSGTGWIRARCSAMPNGRSGKRSARAASSSDSGMRAPRPHLTSSTSKASSRRGCGTSV